MKLIKDLRCQGFKKNISVEGDITLSWRIEGAGWQKAYRVRVMRARGKTPIYDSGRIESAMTRHSFFAELERERDYVALVSVETDRGCDEGRISFRTGVKADFGGAKWIGCENPAAPVLGGCPATYFKRTFTLNKAEQRGYLYISALGLFCAYLNGEKLGRGVLNSPFTDYNERVFYETYDLSGLLKAGENELTVEVGDGWCCQNSVDTWNFYEADFKCEHKLLLRLTAEECEIHSDESFLVSEDGPITRSALRLGEFYDARRAPSYSQRAVVKAAPRGSLATNGMHPIEETGYFKYKSVKELPDGYLLDFGVNIAGYAKVNLAGKAGEQVKLIYSERLTDGDVDNKINAQYIMDEEHNETFQTDIITFGEGRVEFKPRFVYHGFQYIKVLGLKSPPEKDDIVAVRVGTSFEKIGRFHSSSRILNKLQAMCEASQEANFVGIPTDCPHREKNGWTGDLQLSLEQILYNYDCEIDLYKYLLDICHSQREGGEISCIAPTAENIFGYDWGPGPAWDVAMFLLPYEVTKRSGDYSFVKKCLPNLEKYCEYLETKKEADGLVEFGLGDWCPPSGCEVKEAPLKLIASLYYTKMNECMAHFRKELSQSSQVYEKRAEDMKRLIRRAFLHRSGEVANGGACAEAALIYFGVVEGEEREKVFRRLLRTLKRDKYTMRFGIMGAKYVFRTLCDFGRWDIFVKMMRNPNYPSFGNWIKRGAVSLWETYEGKLSLNHYMFSDISAVFYKYLAGIDYEVRGGVQYNTVRINREGGLRRVEAKTATPGGVLAIKQKRDGDKLTVTLTLPPNSKSEFLFENGERVPVETSGEYSFQVS